MGAEGGHYYGAAGLVVAGVVDVLEAGGEVDAAPDVQGVVELLDCFAAVGEGAIAEQKAESTIGEIVLVVLLNSI